MNLGTYNFDPDQDRAEVRRQFSECLAIFQAEAFEPGDPKQPRSCRLHDAFGNRDTDHNCLGCNLADGVELIEAFLKTHPLMERLHHAHIQYLLLNYLLVERLETLFGIIALHEAYRHEHFKILVEVRRWANFIKHPKAFLLTHHAEFTFLESPRLAELVAHAKVKIDRPFVDRFYSDGEKDKALYTELRNKEDVLVILPNAIRVTREMCSAINRSVDLVMSNEVYRWVLGEQSTFLDYWLDKPEASHP